MSPFTPVHFLQNSGRKERRKGGSYERQEGRKEGRKEERERKRETGKKKILIIFFLCLNSYFGSLPTGKSASLFWFIPSHLSHSVTKLSFWCHLYHSLICTLLFFLVLPAQVRLVDRFMASDTLFLCHPHLNFFHLAYPTQLFYHSSNITFSRKPSLTFPVSPFLKPFMLPHHIFILLL